MSLPHERAWDRRDENYARLLDSMLEYGKEALKAAGLVSGGSAAALLAFMGAMANKNLPIADWLPWPFMRMALAFLLSCVATGLAYAAQLMFSEAHRRHTKHIEPPYVRETGSARRFRAVGYLFQALTIIAVVVIWIEIMSGFFAVYYALTLQGLHS